MYYIDKKTIGDLVYAAIPYIASNLPIDIKTSLEISEKLENHPIGKSAYQQLIKNSNIAKKENLPICQDTGTVRVLLEIGKNITISGNVFGNVNYAVQKAYKEEKLRKSVVKDAVLDRTNTNNNTPAFCEIETIEESNVAKLNIMIKGGGSDNASRLHMLVPGDGIDGIIENIVNCVKEKAASACPPLTLGIGIGSTYDKVASLAQKALFRPIYMENPNKELAELENKILKVVNKTQIGAGALGGCLTVNKVNIISESSHIASMPLAIDMGCSALRRITIEIPLKDINDNAPVAAEEINKAIKNAISIDKNKIYKPIYDNLKPCICNNCLNQSFNIKKFNLNSPFNKEELKILKAGDQCLLTGTIYTLRDAGHIRLLEDFKKENKLPYNLEGQTIYYAGPTPEKNGLPFGAIGPTTASRMDFATPFLYENGIVATIGKGKRNKAVHDSCKKNNTVYFVTIGGCAAYLAKCVKSSKTIAYDELGTEALRKIEVENFPVYVGIDTKGNDIYL